MKEILVCEWIDGWSANFINGGMKNCCYGKTIEEVIGRLVWMSPNEIKEGLKIKIIKIQPPLRIPDDLVAKNNG